MIQTLDPVKIIDTSNKLHKRVAERFPDRGLSGVADELCQAARESAKVANHLIRPLVWYRLLSWTGALVLIAVSTVLLILLKNSLNAEVAAHEWLQTAEAATNDFIFIAIAIFFVVRFERILKRNRALRMLHQLRSLAHIIDMHQLTKDPDSIARSHHRTAASPERTLTPYELKRYYDYCSEMLSILSKLAAVLVQRFDDPVTLSAVNEVESLTTGLSRKIWQKIMVASQTLQEFNEPEESTPAPAAAPAP